MEEEPTRRRIQRMSVLIEGRPDSDTRELAHLTGQLRRALLELDVENVELARDPEVRPGAKAIDAVAIGTLIISLAPHVMEALIHLLQSWRRDHAVRSVKVTLGEDSLELTSARPDEVERLTAAFLSRHAVR